MEVKGFGVTERLQMFESDERSDVAVTLEKLTRTAALF
jgi:hypothetical protein